MTDSNVVDEMLKKHGFDSEVITVTQDGITYELTEKRVKEMTSKYIELCGEDATEAGDFGMHSKFVSLLLDVKRTWWPATQKSIHGSVKDFDKQLEKWYILQKDVLEEEKKQQVITITTKKKDGDERT